MPESNKTGIHSSQKSIHICRDISSAKAAMIMLHGRGSNAEEIIQLNLTLNVKGFCFSAPQAYGNSWYPYSFLSPIESNEEGISSGLDIINKLIDEYNYKGIPASKIFLLGFSQGACLLAEHLLRSPQKLGGATILSGGIISTEIDENKKGLLSNTPIFLGCSDIDPHIPLERVLLSEKVLKALGGEVRMDIYKGFGHAINADEMKIVKEMMIKSIQ